MTTKTLQSWRLTAATTRQMSRQTLCTHSALTATFTILHISGRPRVTGASRAAEAPDSSGTDVEGLVRRHRYRVSSTSGSAS